MKKRWIIIIITLFCLAAIIGWTVWCNYTIVTSTYTFTFPDLPKSFDGYRIIQISDLHNAQFGEGNTRLLQAIRDAKPDLIVVTGDMIDSNNPDYEIAASFMEKASAIAPCCYVCGNHENRIPMQYAKLRQRMKQCGVILLDDKAITLKKDGESIRIAGLMDYKTLSSNYLRFTFPGDTFTVLLTHRPEHMEAYVQNGMDLVFAGHAHGGQVRLPLIGALYAPGQGLFPKYSDGSYTESGTTMVVSRGLGNSGTPFRFCNYPELVVVELQCK